ncbi:MAG: LON peptidase substrate-binding domain-containing protein [Gammaproteobacteria bacterium]|nr:LON peptidase substrate-binding domain-containing protein [Gammaproteobacteria bacterium]MDH3767025.1 LON peptidase substrate-binding domain-containing protein [Gammaproteobacteria bacterium]
MRDSELAIFPLNTVLFPGGPLALRIFEPRYLDMVSRCLRDGTSFGVVAIEAGNETGDTTTHRVGTLVRIGDWYTERDGLLGIVVVGTRRFRIRTSRIQTDGLHVAEIDTLKHEPPHAVPERFKYMADLMRSIIDQLGDQYALIDRNFEDASWLGFRLAEILPVKVIDKQAYLESEDALGRLTSLAPVLNALSVDEAQ